MVGCVVGFAAPVVVVGVVVEDSVEVIGPVVEDEFALGPAVVGPVDVIEGLVEGLVDFIVVSVGPEVVMDGPELVASRIL